VLSRAFIVGYQRTKEGVGVSAGDSELELGVARHKLGESIEQGSTTPALRRLNDAPVAPLRTMSENDELLAAPELDVVHGDRRWL